MWYKILLVLLWCSLISFPTRAETLTGDEAGTATGHTTVTARIEMPETSGDDTKDHDTDAQTGDTARPAAYILMSGVCIALIVVVGRLKIKMEE